MSERAPLRDVPKSSRGILHAFAFLIETNAGPARGRGPAPARRNFAGAGAEISAKCCSFSAVSAPIFATKYAFCSIFQILPDFQAEIFEIWQNLQFSRHLQFFC